VWWKLHDPNFSRLWLIHSCDGQTDGQTDGTAIAYARLAYMLSRAKTNGHRIRQISVHYIINLSCVGRDAWTLTYTRQNRLTLLSWRLPCYRYGMICRMSSLIRHSCHFKRDFNRVLLLSLLVDILNTQFKYWEGSWHSSLKRLNCWRKSCAKFASLLLNIQDANACLLEKVNFKV